MNEPKVSRKILRQYITGVIAMNPKLTVKEAVDMATDIMTFMASNDLLHTNIKPN